jgi:hypothetical protein
MAELQKDFTVVDLASLHGEPWDICDKVAATALRYMVRHGNSDELQFAAAVCVTRALHAQLPLEHRSFCLTKEDVSLVQNLTAFIRKFHKLMVSSLAICDEQPCAKGTKLGQRPALHLQLADLYDGRLFCTTIIMLAANQSLQTTDRVSEFAT